MRTSIRNSIFLIALMACAAAAMPCLAGPLPMPEQGPGIVDALPASYAESVAYAGDSAASGLWAVEAGVPERRLSALGNSEMGKPVDIGELATLRGGDGTVSNQVGLDGTVEGNTADRVISGANAISDGAFANASGINTVIQNSGSNVLIQNGMVVNVQFVAPTP